MPAKKQSQVCIITVTGIDKVGIIARLANTMAKANVNIIDVNQKIMGDYFVMTMAIDIAKADIAIEKLKKKLDRIGDEMSLKITVQDVTIFKAMHRV